ncbi:hypothetical protein ACKURH_05195 [Enterobacter soli]|uniref:hypothetical protein n=1 Tax=Enterobacter soli TaxID=885040 RepID=UPI002149425C|nr:hypothetical protein [Enterobacter soli]MCR1316903.1 hypothetical protein [Enterobacter soli]
MDITLQHLDFSAQSLAIMDEITHDTHPATDRGKEAKTMLKTYAVSTSAAMKRLNKVFLKKGQKVHKIRDKRAQDVLGKYCIKDIMTGDIISFSSQLTDWLKEEWLLGYEEFVTDENTNMDGYQQCTGQ